MIADLAQVGVPSRPYFSPLHLQPFIAAELGHRPGDFPVTERVAASTLALPWSARLSDDDVAYAAGALIDAVDRRYRW
jgi:perosamine synthetase